MIKVKELIQGIKNFIEKDPKRARLIGLGLLLALIPLTVLAAQTVQNLTQKASEAEGVQILDNTGKPVPSVISESNVLLKINLPKNWVAPSSESSKNIRSVVKNAYAANTESSGNTDTSSNTTYNQCLQDCAINGQSNCTQACASILTPVPTATPTNTPTPIPTSSTPSCSQRPNCETCVLSFNGVRCGWNGFYCETGTGNNTCPVLNQNKYNQWYWGTCSTNLCATSSTQTPTPKDPCGGVCKEGTVCVQGGLGAYVCSPVATPTPSNNLLKEVLIENNDIDGSSGGGYDPIHIASNIKAALSGLIPWRLNELLPTQTQANRTVKVTLTSTDGASRVFTASVTLVPRGTNTNNIKPISHTTDLTVGDKPTAQLTLTCKNKSTVEYAVKTKDINTPMNFDLFINGNPTIKFERVVSDLNYSNTGPSGNYSVILRDPNTSRLIASAIKEIDCSTFSSVTSTPTPTPSAISSAPVMNLSLACKNKSTVAYVLTTTGATTGMVLDLWINGNKIPQSGWAPNSTVSGTGANGNYAATLRNSSGKQVAQVSKPALDCEVFPFKYDVVTDGIIDKKDVNYVQDQIKNKINPDLKADFNYDKKVDEFDYNIIFSYAKDNL